MKIIKKINIVIFLLVLLGLLLRLFKIFSPVNDSFVSIQSGESLRIIYAYLHNSNIFTAPVQFLNFACPIYPYLMSKIYFVFGIYPFLIRLCSILFFMSTIYIMFKLVKELYSEKVSLIFLFLIMLNPYSILLNRSIIRSNFFLFLMIAGLYFIFKFSCNNKKKYLVLYFLFAVPSFLINPPNLYLLLPITFLLCKYKRQNRIFYILIIWGLSLIPALLWAKYIMSFKSSISNIQTTRPIFELSYYFSWINFKSINNIFKVYFNLVLTPVNTVIFLLCIIFLIYKRYYFVLLWLLGILINYIFDNYIYFQAPHLYNFLPVVIPAALAVALLLSKIKINKLFKILILSLILIGFIFKGIDIKKTYYRLNSGRIQNFEQYYLIKSLLNKSVNINSKIIFDEFKASIVWNGHKENNKVNFNNVEKDYIAISELDNFCKNNRNKIKKLLKVHPVFLTERYHYNYNSFAIIDLKDILIDCNKSKIFFGNIKSFENNFNRFQLELKWCKNQKEKLILVLNNRKQKIKLRIMDYDMFLKYNLYNDSKINHTRINLHLYEYYPPGEYNVLVKIIDEKGNEICATELHTIKIFDKNILERFIF